MCAADRSAAGSCAASGQTAGWPGRPCLLLWVAALPGHRRDVTPLRDAPPGGACHALSSEESGSCRPPTRPVGHVLMHSRAISGTRINAHNA